MVGGYPGNVLGVGWRLGGETKNILENGYDTSFVRGVWVESEPLCEKFNRLFRLSIQKAEVVGSMGRWDESRWSWDLRWSRTLFPREISSLNQLLLSLTGVNFIWTRMTKGNGATRRMDVTKPRLHTFN